MNAAALWLILLLQPAAATAPAPAPAPAPAAATAPASQPVFWDVYRTPQFAVAVPRNWQSQPLNSPAVLLYLTRESRDETDHPLKVGITVERFPGNKDSLQQGVQQIIERIKHDPRWIPQGQVRDEPVTLGDGTAARLISSSMLAHDGARRALQYKLMTLGKDQVGMVVSGFLVAGRDSRMADSDSQLARLLKAHVLSLTLDPQKMNDTALRAAYTGKNNAPVTRPSAPPPAAAATQPARG